MNRDADQTTEAREILLSVVMPCLNEAETLGRCIRKAQAAIRALGVPGEVVVADNGSSDGSPALAQALGARVLGVEEKGYGNALRGGIEAARGRYVVMGDADDSYDFSQIEPFLQALRRGNDLVMGNRFKGGIDPGAMPWKHRWIGNPALSGIGRLFFRSPVGDFHCGMRGFSRAAYQRLALRTTGMEFASEMVVRATLLGLRIAEVPIVLHRDGRSRPPHLRSWRDGWRHLRFMLLLSPLWLFLIPGASLLALGLAGCAWTASGVRRVARVELGIHTLLMMSCLCVVGYQILVFGLFAKKVALNAGLHPPSPRFARAQGWLTLELGVGLGLVMLAMGLALVGSLFLEWRALSFGALSPTTGMRRAIPGSLLIALGLQSVFSSFFLSMLDLDGRYRAPSAPGVPASNSRVVDAVGV